MIVADTSALISLTSADCLDLLLEEFDVQTTALVFEELEQTASYADRHGEAATMILEQEARLPHRTVGSDVPETSRIDRGEGSCIVLANEQSADFLVTDDLRALPELQQLTEARVAISPIVLKALVNRGVLERETAIQRLDEVAETRDWLEAPIYRRAMQLFED